MDLIGFNIQSYNKIPNYIYKSTGLRNLWTILEMYKKQI